MLAVAVVCSPVVDKDTDTVMALFVVSSVGGDRRNSAKCC